RTGQGRQTTTQPQAYCYPREQRDDLYLIDLPGVQQFGLTYLDPQTVRRSFRDFERFAAACQFDNCRHLEEPQCAVRQAIEEGKILSSRYESYLEILEELERFSDLH
ncbi:MAG: hypothetical protein KDD44_03850, partial [Bdellovibrionales bacterium]|nr:hypothetical protein [Bdellovibrionales bacterium]